MIPEDYISMVAWELRDLPWKMRRGLVSEIRGQLGELPPGTDLHQRLGRPHEYAAELRDAAGLDRRRGLIAFLRARRPRNLILAVVVLTLIGLAIGALAWIDAYQPLTSGFGSRYPVDAVESPVGNTESVVFRPGRPFQFGLTVHNRSRFTVRVLGVPYPSGLPFKAELLMGPPMNYASSGMQGPYRRFHAFDLAPGKVRLLFFKGTLACKATERGIGALGLDYFPVRFSFLWRTSTVQIPIDPELAIVFRKGSGCP